MLSEDPPPPAVAKSLKIPLVENEHVEKWIRYFTEKDRERFQRFLNRGDGYREVVEDMLDENELPAELYYLAMIESGFRTDAYSVAKAAGVWQFIPATARRYGLRVDRHTDERRDPIRATEAAAKYLRDLYNAFGSWHLAMAAYNAGEMRVMRAIFKGKSRDFWELVNKGVLPRETANYVPKFLAVVQIGMNPEKHGFTVSGSAKYPDVELHELPGSTPLSEIAKKARIPFADLKRLNPNINGNFLPPGGTYEIWVPSRYSRQLAGASSRIRASRKPWPARFPAAKAESAFHIVRAGENLGSIARTHKITVGHLRRLNKLRGNEIQAGAKLRVRPGSYRHSTLVRYKVKRGDNLTMIAKRFGVPVWKIKKSNRMQGNKIMVGQTLRFEPGKNL